MTSQDFLNHATSAAAAPQDVLGIVVVAIPVSDLATSAAWYRDLLGLTYAREFSGPDGVTGCALADFEARYMLALRRRDTTRGKADLRGEHPVILQVADADAAQRVQARAWRLGIDSTSGVHADGSWTEFLDPDGIALRIVWDADGPEEFMGVEWGADGEPSFYPEPRLSLAEGKPEPMSRE